MGRWKQALVICAALGWWGALYPQFTMVKGTYEIVYEEDSAQTRGSEQLSAGNLYYEILRADRSQIRFKSRLLTEIRLLQEHLQGGGE